VSLAWFLPDSERENDEQPCEAVKSFYRVEYMQAPQVGLLMHKWKNISGSKLWDAFCGAASTARFTPSFLPSTTVASAVDGWTFAYRRGLRSKIQDFRGRFRLATRLKM